MTFWSLLLPKGYMVAAWVGSSLAAAIASLQFSNTITVGSIVVAAFVIILSGVFTLRTNVQSYWRGLAEERQEQIVALQQKLDEATANSQAVSEHARAEMIRFTDEQRSVRHELKNELAALTAKLQVEQAKTDLSALMGLLASQHGESMEALAEGLRRQQETITLLTTLVGNGGSHRPEE